MSQSANFTSKGVEELRGANKAQRSYRKKLCCMVGILLILMLIIIAPILAKKMKNVR